MQARPPNSFVPVAIALLLALLAPPASFAQNTSAEGLPDWERLTPQQREILIAPMRERWNAEPDSRRDLFNRAQRWRQLDPENRQRVRRGADRWQQMTPQQRQQMRSIFNSMRDMPEPERRALRERWRQMTPEQRRGWLRDNAPDQSGDQSRRR